MFDSSKKLCIYMEGALDNDSGKMGYGLMRFSKHPIVCVIDSKFAGKMVSEAVNLPYDIPVISSINEAIAWDKPIEQALKRGLSLINGLHDNLNARFGHLLTKNGQAIWDVRKPKDTYPIASAKTAKLKNKRILMIGTDMAAGKMTTGLELYAELKQQGVKVGFVPTGQIGITLMGDGIPLDAIKVDQAAGAVEQEAAHRNLREPVSHIAIPPLDEFIKLNEAVAGVCGSLTEPKTIGISLNTVGLTEEEAKNKIIEVVKTTGLVTTDVVRYGVKELANEILSS